MIDVAKVKIKKADYRRFAAAAEAAGTPVEQWLTEAADARAAQDGYAARRPAGVAADQLARTWQAACEI